MSCLPTLIFQSVKQNYFIILRYFLKYFFCCCWCCWEIIIFVKFRASGAKSPAAKVHGGGRKSQEVNTCGIHIYIYIYNIIYNYFFFYSFTLNLMWGEAPQKTFRYCKQDGIIRILYYLYIKKSHWHWVLLHLLHIQNATRHYIFTPSNKHTLKTEPS